jgi:hypothetical protein
MNVNEIAERIDEILEKDKNGENIHELQRLVKMLSKFLARDTEHQIIFQYIPPTSSTQ